MFVMVLTLKCWTWLDISARSNVRVLDNDILRQFIMWKWQNLHPSWWEVWAQLWSGNGKKIFVIKKIFVLLVAEQMLVSDQSWLMFLMWNTAEYLATVIIIVITAVMIWRWPLSPGRITTRQTPTKHQHAIYACCMCCAIIIIVVCAMWISCSLLTKRIII